jgi:1,2-phenylacetyl-CoA epoxidase PaaB subunit
MNDIPSDLTYKVSAARKNWNVKAEQKKRANKGSNYRGLTIGDAILSNIKNGLQSYGIHSDAEKLGKLVVRMVGIENKNIEYLSAALFLYNTYSGDIETSADINQEMFDDDTPSMKKIRDKLAKGNETEIIWTMKKINILTYLTAAINHISEGQEDFKPSQAYHQARTKSEEEDQEVAEELEEDQEDMEELPGGGEL